MASKYTKMLLQPVLDQPQIPPGEFKAQTPSWVWRAQREGKGGEGKKRKWRERAIKNEKRREKRKEESSWSAFPLTFKSWRRHCSD